MENLMPLNLSLLCDILQNLISEIKDKDKKKYYLKIKNVLLVLFESKTLNDVKDYYDALSEKEKISWCLEAIKKHSLFSLINKISMSININQSINFYALLTDLVDDSEKGNSKDIVKQSLCFIVLLNIISFSCDHYDQVLDMHSDEKKILENKKLYDDSHKELFMIILYCIEILKTPKNSIPVKLKDFNKDLYYSSSISYLNKLKDDIYKTSEETRNKASNFYSKILEIVGLLIAIFSIIGVNCFTIASQSNIDPFNIVLINSSLAMSISIMLFLVHNIIHVKKVGKYVFVFLLALTAFILTVILYLIKNNVFILHFNG